MSRGLNQGLSVHFSLLFFSDSFDATYYLNSKHSMNLHVK